VSEVLFGIRLIVRLYGNELQQFNFVHWTRIRSHAPICHPVSRVVQQIHQHYISAFLLTNHQKGRKKKKEEEER
jgi:hypothetical protein